MKRRAVLLCAALAVMLCANSAFASQACQDWKGRWGFNYGGSDNQTVYINTVCDSDLGCPKMSIFTCYAQGVREDGQQIMIAGAEDLAPTTWGYYHSYAPNASTPYDRIAAAQYTGRYFDNVTGPVEASCGVCPCTGCPSALGSGLTFGRWLDCCPPPPGKCSDWLGKWAFTYFNLATPANLSDNITANVTITNVCDDNSTCVKANTDNVTDNGTWSCIAKGRRISDNTTLFIGKLVGDDYYRYYNYDNYTQIVANSSIFGQINDTNFFTTEFMADLSALDNTSKNTEPTNLISGARITTTTTSTVIIDPPSCLEWLGTWTLTYDNSTDTLPGDNNGKGRNGAYEVVICTAQVNYVFPILPDQPFPCVAQGKRTADSQGVFMISSPFGPNTYYYELNELPNGALSGGAPITPANFSGTDFTAEPNSFGLTTGAKTSNDTHGCPSPVVPCVLKIAPKKIFPLFTFLSPIAPFVISADKDSGIEFTKPIDIDWGTAAINDIIKIRIGKRIIFGLMIRRPLKLESDNYTVTVTYGDNDTVQCGTIEVK